MINNFKLKTHFKKSGFFYTYSLNKIALTDMLFTNNFVKSWRTTEIIIINEQSTL